MNKKPSIIITINEKYCKGCAICSDFCPKGVLQVVDEVVKVVNEQECTGCKLCEMRCPDLAVEVTLNEN